jgi:hypothetical protein
MMSLQINFLHSHLDFFPESLESLSDEKGELFHQEIANMKQCFRARCNPAMMETIAGSFIERHQILCIRGNLQGLIFKSINETAINL